MANLTTIYKNGKGSAVLGAYKEYDVNGETIVVGFTQCTAFVLADEIGAFDKKDFVRNIKAGEGEVQGSEYYVQICSFAGREEDEIKKFGFSDADVADMMSELNEFSKLFEETEVKLV